MQKFDSLKPLVVAAGLTLCCRVLLASGPWIDEAPPTLDFYMERLPAKTLGQIFVETTPNSASTPQESSGLSISDVIDRLGKVPASELIADVDRLILEARREHADASEFSELHDLRDALVSAPDEAAGYWKARGELMSKADTPNNEAAVRQALEEIDKRGEESKGSIRAHWYYLRSAFAWHVNEKAEARKWFDRIVEELPNDPRAEMASFMSARCSLSISRIDPWEVTPDERQKKEEDAPAALEKARAGFQALLDHAPNGRLTGDALGWLGAVDWDSKDYLGALDCYIRQSELKDHPELLKSSVLMTEKALRKVAATPDGDAAFALIAKHPRAAMGMLYLALGSPDAAGTADNDEPGQQQSGLAEKLRDWRRTILQRLADAVSKQEELYSPEPWMPRYLALLAQTASQAGKQDEAIQLTARLPESAWNDDLIFAAAIAKQRAGKPAEAINSFHKLIDRFPGSPLIAGARIRFAVALRDNHQSGLALIQLRRALDSRKKKETDTPSRDEIFDRYNAIYPPADTELEITDSAIYPDVSNAEADQLKQQIDTVLNFAPLEELRVAADSREIDQTVALEWRAVIAQRALAHEEFELARQYMTPAEYGLIAANLEKLSLKAAAAKNPKEKADLLVNLGDAWAAANRKLLQYPLDSMSTKEAVFHEEPNLAELNRRKNAEVLGFHNADAEMEARVELRHATRWWLEAARTLPASPLSAGARLKVLDAMARIAVASDYSFLRARETGMPAIARLIYDRLQSENPKSDEARKAAYFSLSGTGAGPASSFEGFPEDEGFRSRWAGYLWSDFEAFQIPEAEFGDEDGGIISLRHSSLDVDTLKEKVSNLNSKAKGTDISPPVINCLEDLDLFLKEPHLTPEVAHAYIDLRIDVTACSFGLPFELEVEGVPANSDADTEVRNRIAQALKDPRMKDVRDYLEFLDAAVVANHRIDIKTPDQEKGEPFTYSSRDFPALERMTRSFLKKYPHSRKREAARLLLARAVFRQSWPWIERLGLIPTQGGYDIFPQEFTTKYYQQEPFNPKRVLAELDAYDHEFPKGRYAADIRSMRAGTFWRMGNWKPALELTLDQLDHATPDLRRDASFRLANIFAELANSENRPALLSIIRENKRAKERLGEYLAAAPEDREHPLVLLADYLQNQLGFTVPAPKEKKE